MNKTIDVINLPALPRSTSGTDKIPVYFRDKEPSNTVASKLFNPIVHGVMGGGFLASAIRLASRTLELLFGHLVEKFQAN